MFSRRLFLISALLATLMPCLGINVATQTTNHISVLRWDGLLTQAPVSIDWWDMVPGDLVKFSDSDELRQVASLPFFDKHGDECVKLS
jgi:hypothetical protein